MFALKHAFSNFAVNQNSLEIVLKMQKPGPYPRTSMPLNYVSEQILDFEL